ncbi:MAG: DUF2207 domain-containing protein [Clostridia bacterium]
MLIIVGIAALFVYAIFFDGGDKTYSFDLLHYDVQMLADGDALVSEERTYTYKKGNFTRGFFDLEDGVEDIVVLEKGKPFKRIDDFDSKRPEGSYAYKKQDGVIRLEWYIKASGGQKRTFNIRYKVKKATILYNDCAVYFQKFLSEKNTTEISKVTATVQLVSGVNQNNTLIWGHGPAYGSLEFDKEDKTRVKFELNKVPVKNYVEARFVLDKGLVSNCKYVENKNMREFVVKEETEAGKEADRNRRIAGFSSLLAYLIAAVLILLPIMLRIQRRIHFTRYTPEMKPPYYRDIPENIPPAVLDKLYAYYGKGGNISNQVSGTLMDMIYRGVITVFRQQEGRKLETYIRRTKKKYHKDEITEFESALIAFFFDDIAQGGEAVSMSEVKKFCKKKKNVAYTSSMLSKFDKKLDSMWNQYNYVENIKNNVPNIFKLLILLSIAITISAFVLFVNNAMPQISGAFLILITGGSLGFIISIIVSRKKKMLNQRGENYLALWKGFYNFLNDFTIFEEKDLPELFMWEKYLVYATVLGVAEKVLKQLKLRYPQLNDPNFVQNNMIFMASINAANIDMMGGLNDITQTIQSAVRDAQNVISNLSSSSSSGGGGGFSSGGSSGGGGSGGSTGGGMD